MRFEFKMVPGKPVAKEPPQHPNPFELLKTGEKQKEIIRGEPILTDAFGRTLYQTPNGQFRAIGDMFNLIANIYQTQNNFVTLAPPPNDDEEDTMPKQKPNKQVGTIIIIPDVVAFGFDFCYVIEDGNGNERIYRTELVDENKLLDTIEIFNTPSGYQGDAAWTYYHKAFGFYDKTALVIGYNSQSERKIFIVDYSKNVKKEVVPSIYSYSEFTMYSIFEKKLYFVCQDSERIVVYTMNKNVETTLVKEISIKSGIYNDNFRPGIWKNFIGFVDGTTLNIYDFINNKLITEINVTDSPQARFNLVNFTNEVACFLYSYEANTEELYDQHCIVLNSNGTYQDIVVQGMCAGMDANATSAVIYYFPNGLYMESYGNYPLSVRQFSSLAVTQNKAIHTYNINIYASNDAEKWRWERINPNRSDNIVGIRVLPDDSIIYWTYYGDIYYSNDANLKKWTLVSTFFSGKQVNDLCVLDDGSIIASIEGSSLCSIIYRSTDNCKTWTLVCDPWQSFEVIGTITKFINIGNGKVVVWKDTSLFLFSFNNGISWDVAESEVPRCVLDSEFNCDYQMICKFNGDRCVMVPSEGDCWIAEWLEKSCSLSVPRPQVGSERCIFTNNYLQDPYETYCFPNSFYQTVNDKLELYYASENSIYDPSTGDYYDRIFINKTTDGFWFNCLPAHIPYQSGQQPESIYAEDGIILVSMSLANNVASVYRSTNGGESWNEVLTSSASYLTQFKKYGNKILAIQNTEVYVPPRSFYTYQSLVYSEDEGLTWNLGVADITGIIDIYNKIGDTYKPLKQDEYTMESDLTYPQHKIGELQYSKIYNNKFYFYRRTYNLENKIMVSENGNNTYNNLILDKYHFYYKYVDGVATYCVKNLETNEEIFIKSDHIPHFSPEHLATYILR